MFSFLGPLRQFATAFFAAVTLLCCSEFLVASAQLTNDQEAVQQEKSEPSSTVPPLSAPGMTVAEKDYDEEDEKKQINIEELQRRIDVLAATVEQLRNEEVSTIELTDTDVRALGLSPAAATTYGREQGVSIAGYGEMLYENYGSKNEAGGLTHKGTQLDFLRAIIYAGYRFNDRFLFNSEIEIEHAKEVFVEFAYVDYLAHENFGIRGGMLLVPMGLVNEFHEPTVFLGAERPVTEQRIIPSTWRENGAGIYGSVDRVTFRAYIINGFNGSSFSSTGVRGGRQKGAKAKAGNMAFTGRLDITPMPGVFVGAGLYSGGSGQGDIAIDNQDYDVRTTIVDLHAQLQIRGFDLRGLYAHADLDDVVELNQVLGLEGSSGVAEQMEGGYIQVGYNLLSQVAEAGGVGLTPYIRYEQVDTQATMPAGFERSASTNNTFITLGVDLKPIPNIVVKVDYAWVSNDAESGINQFNVGLGYAF